MQNPKSILITGASSGIGAALAEMYANPGITLFLGGRDQERLDQIAEKCRAKGATATITTVDVLDQIAMSAWIGGANTTNPLDLVIANAGISAGTGGSGESEDQTRHIFAVNVVGVINTLFPALEAMRRRTLRQAQGEPARPKGQIALMSSIAAFRGFPGAPAIPGPRAP
jgi:NADP-dependent 3-hydroxy acid dehydrogenase YdfG